MAPARGDPERVGTLHPTSRLPSPGVIEISWPDLMVIMAAVVIGATVQASIGFGFALIVTPFIGAIDPALVPVAVLVMALPLSTGVLVRERAHLDVRATGQVSIGIVVGTGLGVAVVRAVPEGRLDLAFGIALIVAAIIASGRAAPRQGAPTMIGGGAIGGMVNTIAGIGGPAIAIAFKDRGGPVIRSTLAATFGISTVLAIAGQWIAGRVTGEAFVLGVAGFPAIGLGFWLSHHAIRRLDHGRMRAAVLVFVAVAGVVTIARAV